MGALPPGCAEHRAIANESEFKTWQDLVVESESTVRTEVLPGLVSKRRLSERLRPEITNLRFSPNGRYILAQDDGGIHVVSREPFAFLFYISAPEAREAEFTADSNSIMFSTTGMRVELWSIREQKRKSVREITVRPPCLQTELSPDGSMLACLDREHALKLIDVSSSSVVDEEKEFWHPSPYQLLNLLLTQIQENGEQESSVSLHFVNMEFTPDGHYFLAAYGTPQLEAHPSYTVENHLVMGSSGEGGIVKSVKPSIEYYAEHSPGFLMLDLTTRSKIKVPSSIRDEVGLSFSFLGSDRIVGINYKSPQKSRLLKFPSGEALSDVAFWQGLNLRAAAHGDFLIVGPLKDYPLGVMDLATKENKVVIRQNTADIYDGLILTEQVTGQLALHVKDKAEPVAVLALPEGNLGSLRASAASSDLNLLAVSSRTRGAVWDISRDFRVVQMRRFSAVGFDGAALYADLPEFQGFARQTAELHLDTGAHTFHEMNSKDGIAVQHGLYLLVTKPRKEGVERSNADIVVRDIRSGTVLWSRYFPDEIPSISFDPEIGTAVLRWRILEAAARKELQGLPQLNQPADKDDYLCEVLDANSGNRLSAFILRSNKGSTHFLHAAANQKWAVVEASGDQLIAYAVPSGEEEVQFFGSNPVLSSSSLLAFDNDRREVTLYDLATSGERQQYVFAQPVACKIFSKDGKRLLVFTVDQTVYLFDVTTATKIEKVAASN
jgi:WD40 repeat protein